MAKTGAHLKLINLIVNCLPNRGECLTGFFADHRQLRRIQNYPIVLVHALQWCLYAVTDLYKAAGYAPQHVLF